MDIVEETPYKRIQAKLLDPALSIKTKFFILESNFPSTASLPDVLSLFPGKVWAQLYIDILTHFQKACSIFESLLNRKPPYYFQFRVFKDCEPEKLPFFDKGKFQTEYFVHSFITKVMLAKAYPYLRTRNIYPLNDIFNTMLRFDTFIKTYVKSDFPDGLQFDDPQYLGNYRTLLTNLEAQLHRSSPKYKALKDELIAFLNEDLQAKAKKIEILYEEAQQPKHNPNLEQRLTLYKTFILETDEIYSIIKTDTLKFQPIVNDLLTNTKPILFELLSGEESGYHNLKGFEQDYKNYQELSEKIVRSIKSDEEFLIFIKYFDNYMEQALPPQNVHYAQLIKVVIPLIRICHIILLNVKTKEQTKDRFRQLMSLTLWRTFRKCLYLEAGILIIDYIMRNFNKIVKVLEDSTFDLFITSLFCFLSMAKQNHANMVTRNRYLSLSKQRGSALLEKFLAVIDMKVFAKNNFFVYQNYESEDFRSRIKTAIGKEHLQKKADLLRRTPEYLETFSKFTEKIILILSFLKRNFSKMYLNKYDDWEILRKSLIRLHADLLNLYDFSEVRKIHTDNRAKASPLVFVEEFKYTLIVDCLGLFGLYSQSEVKNLNTYCKHKILINRDHAPLKIADTLKRFVHNNMWFVDVSYYTVFSTLVKLEKSIKQSKTGSFNIQVSQQQLEIEHEKTVFDPQSFNLLKWMYQLIQFVKSDVTSLLEVCVELMNVEYELSNSIMPFLVHMYLQNCAQSDVRKIAEEINNVLENGKIYHRIVFISCLKTLEQWKKEDRAAQIDHLQKIAKEQQSYTSTHKKRGGNLSFESSIPEFDPRKERFIQNFDLLKSLMNNDQLIKTQYQIGEYKEAMLSIDKILSGRSPEEDHDKTYLNYLDLYYRASAKTNDDFKHISFEEVLKGLRIKDVGDILKRDEYGGDVMNKLRDAEQADSLIYDDFDAFVNNFYYNHIEKLCSESILTFDDDRLFKMYILSMLSLASKAVQQFLLNESKNINAYFDQIDLILKNAKLSITISLNNARNNFQHVYPIFVKIQEVIDLEKYIVLLRFAMNVSEKKKSFGTYTMSTEQMDIMNMKISLDQNHSRFILNQGFEIGGSAGNNLIYCFKQIMKRSKKIPKNFKNYFLWLNVTKYLGCLLQKVEKLCFDRLYADLTFKAFRMCYQYHEFDMAQIFYERLEIMKDKVSKPAKRDYLMAKFLKTTKSKKHAIEKLDSIKVLDSNTHKIDSEIFIEIDAKLKIAKYSAYYYSNSHVIDTFARILKKYEKFKYEKLHFKFAKALERINSDPDVQTQAKIVEQYLLACKYGHNYISQSLPRALRIWLQNCKRANISQQGTVDNLGLSMSLSNSSNQPMKNFPEYFKKINQNVENTLVQIEPYKLVTVVQFLVSRLEIADEAATNIMCIALSRIAAQFPYQSVWWLLPLKYFSYQRASENLKAKKSERALLIMSYVKKLNFESWKIINDAEVFYRALLEFGFNKDSNSVPDTLLRDLKSNCVIVPCKRFLSAKMPDRKENVGSDYNPYHKNPHFIVKLDSKVSIMASKERPKKITFICRYQEGGEYKSKLVPFLLKNEPKGDVRKESRTIEMVHFMNEILRKSGLTSGHKLKMKTFSIIPLCGRSGLCEWVEDTDTIKRIVEGIWKMQNIPHSLEDLKYTAEIEDNKLKPKIFQTLNKLKPVFQEYFWDNSASSDEWYDAVINYTKSTAVWSAFGYFIGLGDRHCDNILLHKLSGKVIHIDFDCIFHKGKHLPVPEIIEFRLTKNIEAPFGPFKSYGLFKYYFKLVLKAINRRITDLMEALDSFIYDPLIERSTSPPEVAMQKIRNNISFADYKGLDEAVDIIIDDCKNEKMLKEMFVGWMPHM